jgi:hypothetical protein
MPLSEELIERHDGPFETAVVATPTSFCAAAGGRVGYGDPYQLIVNLTQQELRPPGLMAGVEQSGAVQCPTRRGTRLLREPYLLDGPYEGRTHVQKSGQTLD